LKTIHPAASFSRTSSTGEDQPEHLPLGLHGQLQSPRLAVSEPARAAAEHPVLRAQRCAQHFQQSNTGAGHEFSELKHYLLARLLWDPDVDADAVVKEFLDGYYGAASPWIAKYIAGLRDAVARSKAALDIYEPPASHADDYLARDQLALYNEWFDRAEAAVQADAAVIERVNTARLPLQYAVLEIGKSDLFGPRGFYVQDGERFAPRPEMMRLLEDFFQVALRNGVRTLNEAGLTPKQYYDAVRRFIDSAGRGEQGRSEAGVADPPPSPSTRAANLAILTDGVRGANDFKVQWLGWEGPDFDLVLDLDAAAPASEVSVSTLWTRAAGSSIRRSVTCLVSMDGSRYQEIQTIRVEGDQRTEDVTRTFTFTGRCRASGSSGSASKAPTPCPTGTRRPVARRGSSLTRSW